MPNSNSELTQPQNILQNRLKYLAATLVASSIFIILWGIFARLSVSSQAIGFILPAFSVNPLVSTSEGTVKSLSVEESKDLHELLKKINTTRIKQSITTLAYRQGNNDKNIFNENEASSFPILQKLPELTEYLENIESLLKRTQIFEERASDLSTRLQVGQELNNERGDNPSRGEVCFSKNDPVYIQEHQEDEVKLKQALSQALLDLSILRKNYLPLMYIHKNEVQQNRYLKSLTQQAYELSERKAISKNKYSDVQSSLLSSNISLLNSLKDKQAMQVKVIESYYNVISTYVDYQHNAYLRTNSEICIIERIVPDKAVVENSELLALAIPTEIYNQEKFQRKVTGKNTSGTKSAVQNTNLVEIPFFYPANTDKGIKPSDKALVYPSNVPRNTFGGIKGTVITSGRVLANKSSIRWITGLSDISPYSSEKSKYETMYYGIIRLDKANTPTGYKWTSGIGPNYPILLGTAADVVVQVSTQSPISNILPAIRTVTGLKE
jgi:hypothetical protein